MESTRCVLCSSELQELPLQTAAPSVVLSDVLTLALKKVLNSERGLLLAKVFVHARQAIWKALYILRLAARHSFMLQPLYPQRRS
jgi:hypothetical protein